MNNINYMSRIFINTIENSSSITYNIGVDERRLEKLKEKGRIAVLPFSHSETLNEFRKA